MSIPRIDRLEQNKIINGNFDFWQRGISFPAAGNGYWADRFYYAKNGPMVHTLAQSTDVPNSQSSYSGLVDCTTADAAVAATDFSFIAQTIEGYNFQPLAGKTFTVSFYVKATKVGIYCLTFRNGSANRSYVAEYSVNATDTWERKTITITHDTSGTWDYLNGAGLQIIWAISSGSNYNTTPDTWQNGLYIGTANQVNGCDSTANNFQISQVMVNIGEAAGDFNRAGGDISREFQLCQRYYENARTTGRFDINSPAAATVGWQVSFNTYKRATPVMSTALETSSGDWTSNVAYNVASEHGFSWTKNTGSGGTTARVVDFFWKADSEL